MTADSDLLELLRARGLRRLYALSQQRWYFSRRRLIVDWTQTFAVQT